MRLDAQFLAISLLKLSAGLKYDYVIVGAGPSGLVMANRLSEDPLTTVAVIEAGQDERENPLVVGSWFLVTNEMQGPWLIMPREFQTSSHLLLPAR
jgi:choline dehydrogenase-like flavoprotein